MTAPRALGPESVTILSARRRVSLARRACCLRLHRDHLIECVQDACPIHVDVGHDALHRGCRKMPRSSPLPPQAFLRPWSPETERSAPERALMPQTPRQCSATPRRRRIVHRTVVDRVAMDRRSDSEMIQVSTQNNIFLLEFRIGSRQAGDDVWAGDLTKLGYLVESHSKRHRKRLRFRRYASPQYLGP